MFDIASVRDLEGAVSVPGSGRRARQPTRTRRRQCKAATRGHGNNAIHVKSNQAPHIVHPTLKKQRTTRVTAGATCGVFLAIHGSPVPPVTQRTHRAAKSP